MPFSGEVIDMLGELAQEKLPEHALDRGREERAPSRRAGQGREDAAWYE